MCCESLSTELTIYANTDFSFSCLLASVGAASAKQRIDCVIRDSINAGDIPGPRSLANGREVRTPPAHVLGLLTHAESTFAIPTQMAPRDGALVAGSECDRLHSAHPIAADSPPRPSQSRATSSPRRRSSLK